MGIYFDHFPYYRICWPISADQSAAAVHLTENLNVGFELFQVRTGDGLKPIARRKGGLGVNNTPEGTREAVGVEIRQIIDLTRSEKGWEMRRNANQDKVCASLGRLGRRRRWEG